MTTEQIPSYKLREIVGATILAIVFIASLVALDLRSMILAATGLIYVVGRRVGPVLRSKPVRIYRRSSRSRKIIMVLLVLVLLQLPIALLSDWRHANLSILVPGLIVAAVWLMWLTTTIGPSDKDSPPRAEGDIVHFG